MINIQVVTSFCTACWRLMMHNGFVPAAIVSNCRFPSMVCTPVDDDYFEVITPNFTFHPPRHLQPVLHLVVSGLR